VSVKLHVENHDTLDGTETRSLETCFGAANLAPAEFTQFLLRNSLPTFSASVTLRRNDVITGIKSSWEIILYGEVWADVVRESHFVVQDIGSCLGSRTRVVAADTVFWAGPRVAMRHALRGLGIAALAGVGPSLGLLALQPTSSLQTVLSVYGISFVSVFLPGLAIIALTK